MDFVINGQVIDKNFVSQLRDKYNQNDQRQIAKHVFTKMFEHAKAEILNDNLLEELSTSCNQAGYDGSLLMQLSPVFLGHDLQLPDAIVFSKMNDKFPLWYYQPKVVSLYIYTLEI